MRKKLLLPLFLLLLAGAIAYFLLKPKPLSDREAISLLFQKAVQGIRERNAQLLLSLFSSNYQDSFGITYEDIRRNLRSELNRAVVLDLTIQNIQPVITPPDARVGVQCTLLIQMEDMNQPLVFPLYADVYLKKEKKRWRIIRIEGYSGVVKQIYGEEF